MKRIAILLTILVLAAAIVIGVQMGSVTRLTRKRPLPSSRWTR